MALTAFTSALIITSYLHANTQIQELLGQQDSVFWDVIKSFNEKIFSIVI